MEEGPEDGFVGYVPQTKDLGGWLLAVAILSFVVAYAVVLPLMLSWDKRRAEKRKAPSETMAVDDDEEDSSGHSYTDGGVEDAADQKSVGSSNSNSTTVSGALEAFFDQRRSRIRSKKKRRERRKYEKRMQVEVICDNNMYEHENPIAEVNGESLITGIFPGGLYPPSEHPDFAAAHQSHTADNNGNVEVKYSAGADREHRRAVAPDADSKSSPPRKSTSSKEEDFSFGSLLDKMVAVAEWDAEMKRIIRLCTPYCIQAFVSGLLDILTVAVVGKLISTRAASAFLLVDILLETTSDIVGGVHDALGTLASQAIGVKNKKLAGQYVQIVIILYSIGFIPFMVIWALYIDRAVLWFGFDEETAQIAKNYTYIVIFDLLVDGVGEAIHELLDVGGLENYSTLIGAIEEVVAFIIVLLVALFGDADLNTVGLIQFGIGILFLTLNVIIIVRKGWHLPYKEGLIGSFALSNTKAVWLVVKTAVPLSVGTLVMDGEWEVLTLFASFLGPAEVAAWAIYGTICDGYDELIDAIADAFEVRCAYLLGSGLPERAKLSASKGLLVGTSAGILLLSFLFMAGEDLPRWLTNDPVLQHLLKDLLPIFGFSNLLLAVTSISWTILGSQGRYRLATTISCLCTALITIPLSALLSIGLNVNLQGQTAAYVLGYLVTGVIQTYYVLRSDWYELSRQVIDSNAAELLQDTSNTKEPPSNNRSIEIAKPKARRSSTNISTTSSNQMTPLEISSNERVEKSRSRKSKNK